MKKILYITLFLAAHNLQAMDRSGLSSALMYRTNEKGERVAIGHLPASMSFNTARQMVYPNWDINQSVDNIQKTPVSPITEAPTFAMRAIVCIQSWIKYLSSSK